MFTLSAIISTHGQVMYPVVYINTFTDLWCPLIDNVSTHSHDLILFQNLTRLLIYGTGLLRICLPMVNISLSSIP